MVFAQKLGQRSMKASNRNMTKQQSRHGLRRWLQAVIAGTEIAPDPSKRLLLEPLEQRQLMAGDVDLTPVDLVPMSSYGEAADISETKAQGEPQGEPAQDLVAFAKALKDAGVRFFGAIWCPFCNEQKALFGDGAQYLPFEEVTNPNRSLNALGIAEDIKNFPTWEFQNGSREEGVLTLAQLSQKSGIAIPTSNTPSMAPIGNQTVLIGAPLYIPVDGYNPDGTPLTISVTSSNPSLLQATVLQGNKSVKMNLQNWGEMTFELFDTLAPGPTSRIKQLIQSGFYNKTATNTITFHRVIDDFVLQAGDPTGTGSGGSTLGDIDDQFNLDLQHNRTGLLSYAKSGDDTNDSQFFITEGAQRHLDFNHSIFGMLVEGESVREGISETPTNSTNKPTTDVIINSMQVFDDAENGVIQLKALGGQTGTSTVTVTVTNADGKTSTQTFTVTIANDTVNTAPFLDPVTVPPPVAQGQPIQIQLSSKDVEGDAVTYFARKTGNVNYTTSVNQSTGVVTVTPPAGYSGPMDVILGVNQTSGLTFAGAEDTQIVRLTVSAGAPTAVDLVAGTDTGVSNSDNITSASSLQFTVTGVTAGATVKLKSGTTELGSAVVGTGQTSVTITTTKLADLGNGARPVVATQTIDGVESAASPALTVTLDTSAPAQITGDVLLTAIVGNLYATDLQHPDEEVGITYALQTSPAGMTINASTGVVNWTPTSTQTGTIPMVVTYTDLAGNTSSQTFNIVVADSSTANVRLALTDLNNNPITSIASGQEFLVKVFVRDNRGVSSTGLFAAYMDVFFDPQLATVSTTDPITYSFGFGNVRRGAAAKGVIDEFGATNSSTTPTGPGEQALGTIRLKAIKSGSLTVTTNPGDTSGTDFLAYGVNTPVDRNRIAFASANLTVTGGFTASNDTFNLNEDATNFAMDVLANDQAQTGTTVTIKSTSTPTNGTVTISSDKKTLTYTPKANFNGGDLFTYIATDSSGAEQTATVTVQVQPVNDAPTANNDSFRADVNSTSNALNVLANDSTAPDTGETLRVTAVGTTSSGGTVTIQSGGNSLIYTPKAGFSGSETFTYTISDAATGGLTSTATVTVNVGIDNAPPNAVNDSFPVVEDAAAADFNLVQNDSTSDTGETISVSAVGTPNNGGTVSLLANGTGIRYQPKANFFGVETVTYTLRDSRGAVATGTVTFTVSGTNDPPTAVNDTARIVKESGATAIQVLDNDLFSPDGTETLTITAVSTASKGGTVTINSAGTLVFYTPPSAGFVGTDTFTYTIKDPSGATATATVTVNVVDYVPRSLEVNLDTSFDGFNYNLPLTLTGTDSTGQSVTLTAKADSSGKVVFTNQAPGTYTVKVGQVPFFVSGSNMQTQITSGSNEGNSTGNMLNLGSLDPKYVSILDFVTSTPIDSLLVALKPGETHTWLTQAPDLGGLTSPSVKLSTDAKIITITGTKGGQSVTSNLPVSTSGSLVQLRGREGDYYLFRVGAGTGVTYTNVTTTTASGEPNLDGTSLGSGSELALALPQGDLFSTQPNDQIDHDAASTSNDDSADDAAAQGSATSTGSSSGTKSNTGLPTASGEPDSEDENEAVDAIFNLIG